MKLRIIIYFLVFVVVMTGCTNDAKEESKITLDNVTQAMENQGLKLLQIHPKGITSSFEKLNEVVAATFAIDMYKMGDVTDEINADLAVIANVYIYVFETEQARIEGRNDLNDKLALANFASAPSVFENKNVLVIHFKHKDEKAEYDEMIKAAVIGL